MRLSLARAGTYAADIRQAIHTAMESIPTSRCGGYMQRIPAPSGRLPFSTLVIGSRPIPHRAGPSLYALFPGAHGRLKFSTEAARRGSSAAVAEPVVEKIEEKELHVEASEAYLSVSNAPAVSHSYRTSVCAPHIHTPAAVACNLNGRCYACRVTLQRC